MHQAGMMRPIDLAWRRAMTDVGLVAWTANPRSWRVTRVTAPDGVLFGFPRCQWIRPGFWMSRVLPEDRDRVAEFLSAAARDEAVSVCEYHITDCCERVRYIRSSASLAVRRRKAQIAGIHQDVTRERVAEEARAAAERRYDLATQLGRVSLWQHDQTTGAMQSDPVLLRMLGLDPAAPPTNDEWVGRIHPEDRSRVVEQSRRIVADGPAPLESGINAPRIEFRVQGGSGDWRWLTKAEMLVAGNGHAPQLASVIADITAEVHEREARRRAEQL